MKRKDEKKAEFKADNLPLTVFLGVECYCYTDSKPISIEVLCFSHCRKIRVHASFGKFEIYMSSTIITTNTLHIMMNDTKFSSKGA